MSKAKFNTALIVGAGSGLSASLTRALAKEGIKVALAARTPGDLDALAKETGARAFACDASKRAEVEKLFAEVDAAFGAPDIVMSDMAPNTVGHRQTDHLRIVMLIEAAADFAIEVLKPGGTFITKAFQGGETAEVLRTLKAAFTEVKHVKPKASRQQSSEVYLVATGLRPRG